MDYAAAKHDELRRKPGQHYSERVPIGWKIWSPGGNHFFVTAIPPMVL